MALQSFLTEGNLAHLNLGQLQGTKIQSEREEVMNRWRDTGFLDGLEGRMEENIAQLYENTAHWILNETTGSDTSGSFETIAFPLIRRTFTKLLANDIVTVQALNMPIGKIFYYRPLISERTATGGHYAYEGAYANRPLYTGTTNVASQNTYGLANYGDHPTFEPNLSNGPTLYDQYYATLWNDFGEGLFDRSKPKYTIRTTQLSGSNPTTATTTFRALVTGFSNSTQYGRMIGPSGVEIDTEEFMAGLVITCNTAIVSPRVSETIAAGTALNWRLVLPRWGAPLVNQSNHTVEIEVDLSVPGNDAGGTGFVPAPAVTAGTISAITQFGAVWREYAINENDSEMAEVTFDLDEVTIEVGKARKMRANWTPELAMDVQRFQNIDAEAELTNLLSETISNEIDSEIIRDLVKQATFTEKHDYLGWRTPGTSTYYGTQKDWNQLMIEKINQIDAQIYKSTLDGGANFLIVSPEITAAFQNLEYFHAVNATTDDVKYSMGIERVGTLSNRYTVYQNVKMPSGVILIGRKGDSVMKSGFVYAPYQPITLTPIMTDPRTFSNIRGIMTRYATKLLNARYYGKLIVHGLPKYSIGDLR